MDLKDGTDIAPSKVFQVKDRGCVVSVFCCLEYCGHGERRSDLSTLWPQYLNE